ncbi:serine hydrolase [uncultured Clostridium sp.]|uniref:serine hydrolase n=1 Tax=uncultured Clostridium sp. TaxID=59620 RepID=UPI0028EE9FDD|nr:serine hydrolase [uncultured Clostridium sp.]
MKRKSIISICLCFTLISGFSTVAYADEIKTKENNFSITNYNKEKHKEGFVDLNDNKYFFKDNGKMAIGWLEYLGDKYFFNANGDMRIGWLSYNNKLYYLNDDGKLATKWKKLSDKWYYFNNNDGIMQTGWISYKDKWYYLKDNGEMAIGWIKDKDKWYYLHENGEMAHNTTIGNDVFASNGVWHNGKFIRAEKAAKDYIGTSNVGVYCIGLENGEIFEINGDNIYPAASTAKLSAILYTQKRLNQGSINLNTSFKYYDSVNNMNGAYQRGGSGVLQDQLREGEDVTIETLLKTTCSYSDNLGANLLAYYVSNQSDENFRSYIKSILGREIINFTHNLSSKDLALLMKEIYSEGGLALESLKNTSWDDVKIPKYLPVTVAHKIGIHSEANNDVAIVYANDPYVIVIMTPSFSDEYISKLSKIIYDELK